MSRRLVIRELARLEALAALEWYHRESAELANRFAATLEEVLVRVREQPLAHPKVHGEVRRAILKPFRHLVYFRLRGDVVVVLAIVHASRDPRAWQSRR